MGRLPLSPPFPSPRRRILDLPLSPFLSSSVSYQSSEGKGGLRESAPISSTWRERRKRTFFFLTNCAHASFERLLVCYSAIVQSRHYYKDEVCGLGKCACVYVFFTLLHCWVTRLLSLLPLSQTSGKSKVVCIVSFLPPPKFHKQLNHAERNKRVGENFSAYISCYTTWIDAKLV